MKEPKISIFEAKNYNKTHHNRQKESNVVDLKKTSINVFPTLLEEDR